MSSGKIAGIPPKPAVAKTDKTRRPTVTAQPTKTTRPMSTRKQSIPPEADNKTNSSGMAQMSRNDTSIVKNSSINESAQ